MRFVRAWAFLLVAIPACSHNPSVLLDPAGPHAGEISRLFWIVAAINGVVWLVVTGVLLIVLWRQRAVDQAEPAQPVPRIERRLVIAVGAAIAFTALVLTIYVGLSYAVDRQLLVLDREPEMEIEITAHQWWWELKYLGQTPAEVFTTANEIHVPVGKKVRLILKSQDVIHSLWFPNLSGKQDIIPGREQDLVLRADRAGIWQGRCGEFCGLQHAKMGLALVAEPPEVFSAWQQAQRRPAAEPQTDEGKRGREIFRNGPCALCHAIRSEDSAAYSNNAPDLTHLKSRATIGAGAAPNTEGHLGGWIVDPHSIKPGVHMPTILQEPADFRALLAYLETLK